MSKILLVYDDFAELNATELSLKKCNFDVIGLTNEYTVKDQIVSFNPEILVGFGNSTRVSSLSVGKKIKEMTRWSGKSVLIFPKGYELPADELMRMRMDMLLESPISVIRLIQIICKLTKQDEKAIIEKLAKSFAKDRGDKTAFASYDADTMKAIHVIQGELDNLSGGKPLDALPQNGAADAIVSGSGDTEEKPSPVKKSFFEKEDTPAVISEADPFAALISELKGENPEAANAAAVPAKSKATTLADASADTMVPGKPPLIPDADVVNPALIGEQVQLEIAAEAGKLHDRVKKYDKLIADMQLYPESMIKKVKAKKQLNELKKGWNPQDLEDQDKARREFVSQLFNGKKDKK